MNKIITIGTLVSAAALLSACSLTTNDIHQISANTLSSGKVVKVGYKAPKDAWDCKQVAKKSHNWATEEFKGMFTGNGYSELKNQALAYANKEHIDANYIYLDIPAEFELGAINLTALSNAKATYYQCQNPPAVNNSMF